MLLWLRDTAGSRKRKAEESASTSTLQRRKRDQNDVNEHHKALMSSIQGNDVHALRAQGLFVLDVQDILPPPKLKNVKNAIDQEMLLKMETLLNMFIANKIAKRCELSNISVINPIFGTYKSDGESVQFIIDLRYINKFMKKYKFKLDTIKVIRQMIIKGDYFISVDLSKVYYHLPVNEEHQQYLGFSINGKYYQMLALLMGRTTEQF